jgi:hypothetical protein
MRKGNSTAEGLLILAVVVVIMLVTYGGGLTTTSNPFRLSDNNAPSSRPENQSETTSSYAKNISLSAGNASYTYQSYEEYISIRNSGREPINITSWQLKNGKDRRTYELGGNNQRLAADIALIPQAALFVSPTGNNIFQNVVLQSGETAVITTGQIGSQLPYKIVSFKENMCSGYLEDLPEYTFTPPLSRNCPRPANEPGVNALDTQCRKFVERMQSCRTPKFDTRTREGDICSNCVDGELLSSSCVAFIKNHFNYGSCIANHQSNPDFSDKTWRIFLGRSWEMWAKEYEIIELFDQLGQLVDFKTY